MADLEGQRALHPPNMTLPTLAQLGKNLLLKNSFKALCDKHVTH